MGPKRARRDRDAVAPTQQESAGDAAALTHELSVYQEELRAQNEALIQAQNALEQSRDRFVELYDLAPTGYMTLDRNGVVLQCNITAAAMFGKARPALEGLPLIGIVSGEERQRYLEFLRRCRTASTDVAVTDEFVFRTPDGPKTAELMCRRRTAALDAVALFVSLVDVSERRELERERDRIAKEHLALVVRLFAAQDDERHRIARNLHDDIGQQHTVIRMKLEHLAEQAEGPATQKIIADLRDTFARLDQRIHFVATELRPASLDLGLVSALDQYVREWSETFDVPGTFLCPTPDTRFTPEVETHLYRIAQEALNNVSKHAAAHNVSVILEVRDGGAVLIVEDDGRGFDVAGTSRGDTPLGLIGMRERAHVIGGRIQIESSPDYGTAVFVHVPFSNRPSR